MKKTVLPAVISAEMTPDIRLCARKSLNNLLGINSFECWRRGATVARMTVYKRDQSGNYRCRLIYSSVLKRDKPLVQSFSSFVIYVHKQWCATVTFQFIACYFSSLFSTRQLRNLTSLSQEYLLILLLISALAQTALLQRNIF